MRRLSVMEWIAREWSYIVSAALLLCVCPGDLWAQTENGSMEIAMGKWRLFQSDVVTAKASVKVYRYAPSKSKVPRSVVLPILQNAKDSTPARALIDQFASQFSPRPEGPVDFWGVDLELYQEGKKLKNVWRQPTRTGQDYTRVVVFDGVTESQYVSTNNQADIFTVSSGMQRIDISQLRYIPFLTPLLSPEQFTVKGKSGDIVSVSRNTTDMQIDLSCGFVPTMTVKDSAGNVDRDMVQLRRKDGGSAFQVPEIRAMAYYYAGDVLRLLDIYHIVQITVNEELEPGTFELGVPVQTKIVDHRSNPHNPALTHAAAPVANLAQYQYDGPYAPGRGWRQQRIAIYIGATVLILGLIAFAILLTLYLRQRRRESGRDPGYNKKGGAV